MSGLPHKALLDVQGVMYFVYKLQLGLREMYPTLPLGFWIDAYGILRNFDGSVISSESILQDMELWQRWQYQQWVQQCDADANNVPCDGAPNARSW